MLRVNKTRGIVAWPVKTASYCLPKTQHFTVWQRLASDLRRLASDKRIAQLVRLLIMHINATAHTAPIIFKPISVTEP